MAQFIHRSGQEKGNFFVSFFNKKIHFTSWFAIAMGVILGFAVASVEGVLSPFGLSRALLGGMPVVGGLIGFVSWLRFGERQRASRFRAATSAVALVAVFVLFCLGSWESVWQEGGTQLVLLLFGMICVIAVHATGAVWGIACLVRSIAVNFSRRLGSYRHQRQGFTDTDDRANNQTY